MYVGPPVLQRRDVRSDLFLRKVGQDPGGPCRFTAFRKFDDPPYLILRDLPNAPDRFGRTGRDVARLTGKAGQKRIKVIFTEILQGYEGLFTNPRSDVGECTDEAFCGLMRSVVSNGPGARAAQERGLSPVLKNEPQKPEGAWSSRFREGNRRFQAHLVIRMVQQCMPKPTISRLVDDIAQIDRIVLPF